MNIETEKINLIAAFEKYQDKIWEKLENIENKIVSFGTELTVLKTEHNQIKNNCKKKNAD